MLRAIKIFAGSCIVGVAMVAGPDLSMAAISTTGIKCPPPHHETPADQWRCAMFDPLLLVDEEGRQLKVDLGPLMPARSTLYAPTRSHGFRFAFIDRRGRLLRRQVPPILGSIVQEPDGTEAGEVWLEGDFAIPPGTARIRLERNGKLLDQVVASRREPTAKMSVSRHWKREKVPVKVRAHDPDGDRVTGRLYRRYAGESSWHPVRQRILRGTTWLDATNFNSERLVYLRLLFTDGFHGGGQIIGPIRIARRDSPPIIDFWISDRFCCEPLQVRAFATDANNFEHVPVTWFDGDTPLGNSNELVTIRFLGRLGPQSLTVEARDREGRLTRETREFNLTPLCDLTNFSCRLSPLVTSTAGNCPQVHVGSGSRQPRCLSLMADAGDGLALDENRIAPMFSPVFKPMIYRPVEVAGGQSDPDNGGRFHFVALSGAGDELARVSSKSAATNEIHRATMLVPENARTIEFRDHTRDKTLATLSSPGMLDVDVSVAGSFDGQIVAEVRQRGMPVAVAPISMGRFTPQVGLSFRAAYRLNPLSPWQSAVEGADKSGRALIGVPPVPSVETMLQIADGFSTETFLLPALAVASSRTAVRVYPRFPRKICRKPRTASAHGTSSDGGLNLSWWLNDQLVSSETSYTIDPEKVRGKNKLEMRYVSSGGVEGRRRFNFRVGKGCSVG